MLASLDHRGPFSLSIPSTIHQPRIRITMHKTRVSVLSLACTKASKALQPCNRHGGIAQTCEKKNILPPLHWRCSQKSIAKTHPSIEWIMIPSWKSRMNRSPIVHSEGCDSKHFQASSDTLVDQTAQMCCKRGPDTVGFELTTCMYIVHILQSSLIHCTYFNPFVLSQSIFSQGAVPLGSPGLVASTIFVHMTSLCYQCVIWNEIGIIGKTHENTIAHIHENMLK